VPHFDWNFSFGQLVVSVPLLWAVFMLGKIYNMLLRFRIEHETLMIDWASRQDPPVRLTDLPTRQSKWW
jgi:hypothetical protein